MSSNNTDGDDSSSNVVPCSSSSSSSSLNLNNNSPSSSLAAAACYNNNETMSSSSPSTSSSVVAIIEQEEEGAEVDETTTVGTTTSSSVVDEGKQEEDSKSNSSMSMTPPTISSTSSSSPGNCDSNSPSSNLNNDTTTSTNNQQSSPSTTTSSSTTDTASTSSTPSSSATSSSNLTMEEMETVERLEKYGSSEIIFHRQVASRSILETLHEVRCNPNELIRVASVVSRFASDNEPSIRAELAEQLPQIACFCLNPANGVPSSMSNITLPIIEQFLSDSNSQVRKITQNSLCFMLEQSIIDLTFIEDKISPILVHLMDISNLDDFRIEAVTTISKIVRFLGKEVTERIFLHHYALLCTDVSFHVRRVCAANIGEISTVVGQSLTESVLLPQFKTLCEDGIWGVRKACADVFVPVSCVCSNQVRRDTLGPLFVSLLCDQSKWVKTAAYQALGPFISTFADPRKTGLYYNDGGVIVVGKIEQQQQQPVINNVNNNSNDTQSDNNNGVNNMVVMVNGSSDNGLSDDVDVDNNCHDSVVKMESNEVEDLTTINKSKQEQQDNMQVDTIDGPVTIAPSVNNDWMYNNEEDGSSQMMEVDAIKKDEEEEGQVVLVNGHCSTDEDSSTFNTFQFWRVPIPDIIKEPTGQWQDQEPTDLSTKSTNTSNDCDDQKKETTTSRDEEMNINIVNHEDEWKDDFYFVSAAMSSSNGTINNNNNNEQSINNGNNNSVNKKRIIPDQDTIPRELLEHYLDMTSPSNFDSIDNDLTHHCAFSLPAVAMTLGRKYWPCLRETFESLSCDMQWKVRWTLASSLHQMAQILGPEYTSKDLLPAFLNFMKDLDEVRFGILQNLSSILKLLDSPEQLTILPKISDFMRMDNPRNWRFRSTLGTQINSVVTLYHPSDIKEYLLPVAFALLRDKVSEVRIGSIKLLSSIMKHFYTESSWKLPSLTPEPEMDKTESVRVNLECLLISELTSLVDSNKWIYRQVFVFLLEQMVSDKSLPNHIFNDHFIPPLLSLANDRVPNVRMALARCLVRSIYGNVEMFDSQQEVVIKVLNKFLNEDTDSDVKRFANMIRSEDVINTRSKLDDKLIMVNGNVPTMSSSSQDVVEEECMNVDTTKQVDTRLIKEMEEDKSNNEVVS